MRRNFVRGPFGPISMGPLFPRRDNTTMKKMLRSRGAALTDYGLLAGLIAAGAIVSVATTGDEIARAYCKATNGMLEITGGELQAFCIEDPNLRVTLAEDERFVDTPVAMQADFTDMLFANLETGDRLIMSPVKDGPAESFQLNTELTSRDPHEPDRQISSCYSLGGGVDPICGNPGTTSTVAVPAGAEAFGYSVSLSEDTEMPWANDVAISIPAPEGMDPQVWNIEVAREEAEVVLEGFAVAFGPHSFQQSDSGWTYGAFAPIEGKFNRPLRVSMQSRTDMNRERKACYLPQEGAEPICSPAYSKSSTISLDVAPGAYALGYQIELPAPRLGPDWEVTERFRVFHDTQELHLEDVVMTRPNEAYQTGSVQTTFASPYSFAQTDTGWTEGEFIALEGERNVNLEYSILDGSGYGYQRKACYKTVAGGEPTCSDPESGREDVYQFEIPPAAVEVGYMVQLPVEGVGPATTGTDRVWLSHGGTYLIDKNVTWERPNEPYATGSVPTTFASPYSFAQTDTGWTEGEFIALEGERNVDLQYSILDGSRYGYQRKACYKTEAGGEPTCSAPESGREDIYQFKIPPEAVEVGYMVQLPVEGVGPATTGTDRVWLSHGGTYLIDKEVTWERPNEPYATGSVPVAYSTPHVFAQTDTSWTEGEFIALEGQRNVDLEYTIYDESNYVYQRKACYKTVVGGEPSCSDSKSGRDVVYNFKIPPEAVEVGYMIQLPAEGVGPATTGMDRHYLRHGATTLFDKDVTWERPNEAYETGSVPAAYSTPHVFAQTDTSWTEGEFVALDGPRNVTLDYYIYDISDYPFSRKACYKTEVGGVPQCGTSATGKNWATHKIPPEAVEVGYMVSLPGEGVGPATTGTDRHYLRHLSTSLMDLYVTWERPNADYERGAMAQPYSDHTFASGDSAWTEAQFVALDGPRNVNLDYYIYDVSDYPYARKACYKTEVGGAPDCGASKTGNGWATHVIPPSAVEVGYMVYLPGPGAEIVGTDQHRIYHQGTDIFRGDVTWTRPAQP